MLMDADVYAEEEVLKGVTENIMMGQLARVGTSDMDLLLDEQKVLRHAVEIVTDQWGTEEQEQTESYSSGSETPYAPNTPFQNSPMIGGEMASPMVGGNLAFLPSYIPTSGTYGNEMNSSFSPAYPPFSPS